MADPIHRSALEVAFQPGDFGAPSDTGEPGVTLAEGPGETLVHIAGDAADAAFMAAVEAATGVALPADSGAVNAGSDGDKRLLWLGPDQWLLKTEASPFGDWERRLAAAAPMAAFNEVTHGRTTINVSGVHARDTLAAGCPLDFHRSAFRPASCAQSLLGHLNVLIECRSDDSFDVSVTRSYGVDLAAWLTRAAAEFGYRISA